MTPESDRTALTEVRLCEEGLRRYREALEAGTVSGEVPGCLVRSGLLKRLPGGPGVVYVPVPPAIAESLLARHVERDIEERRKSLEVLHSSFLAAEAVYRKVQRRGELPIESLHGEEVIGEALRKAVASCREELLTAQPGGGRPPALLAEALPRDLALLRKGVRQRTLYQHSVRSHTPTLAYIEQVLAEGARVRTVDEIFERVIICDRTIAFIPGTEERKSAALAVRHSGVIDFLTKMFDHAWERGEPVAITAERHRPDLLTSSVRRTVLRMVVSGHTDESIATRLGMSARTVSTHIRKVSEALGSRSRAELGYLLSQRRLLDEGGGLPDGTPRSPARQRRPPTRESCG
ncbi:MULTISPECIES: helix-turn-helix transcriptional regulator [unclassified Streptomyces]|uniref:helix-turn-helix transcriptional regulator n=1 Tax=unclassified Streptomyces TaxID=2593676 RepID=UPI0008237EEA|nr:MULTISPECIES: helix-turn-helix transcriptional regulator [unclassified Streptomyces]SCK25318.1 Response regulator containing a CheY-like receiver domain and an HTH DNA-binding domain [Streptomyces sp. AmelKG-D3]